MVTVDDGTLEQLVNQPTDQFITSRPTITSRIGSTAASRTAAGIGYREPQRLWRVDLPHWHPVGGDERDYMLPDPTTQTWMGSGMGGRASRDDGSTGQVANVTPGQSTPTALSRPR